MYTSPDSSLAGRTAITLWCRSRDSHSLNMNHKQTMKRAQSAAVRAMTHVWTLAWHKKQQRGPVFALLYFYPARVWAYKGTQSPAVTTGKHPAQEVIRSKAKPRLIDSRWNPSVTVTVLTTCGASCLSRVFRRPSGLTTISRKDERSAVWSRPGLRLPSAPALGRAPQALCPHFSFATAWRDPGHG